MGSEWTTVYYGRALQVGVPGSGVRLGGASDAHGQDGGGPFRHVG